MVNLQSEYCPPEGFDPKKATVPRLRSILLQFGIDCPKKAKKPELVILVETEVLPKHAKLGVKMADVTPSSKGIEDAGQ